MLRACYEHTSCEHGNPECQCSYCWEWPSQCANTHSITEQISPTPFSTENIEENDDFFLEVKLLVCEANHSLPYSTEVRMRGAIYPPTTRLQDMVLN
jgi:hypothetical protein